MISATSKEGFWKMREIQIQRWRANESSVRPTKAERSSSLTGYDGEGSAFHCKMEEILRGFVGSYNGNKDRGSGRVVRL
jgi:hypothetical protein